jgi:type II secretory pathway component PulM
MNDPMSKRDKTVMAAALIFGVIAYCLCWIYRDEIDPHWEQRLEKERYHMEEMDRKFR